MTATAARCGTPLSEAASRGFGNNTNKKQLNKDMKTKRRTTTDRLGAYLTATLGTSLLAAVHSDAAIQIIDISAFDGPNGGVPSAHFATFDFAGVTNGLQIYSNYSDFHQTGLDGEGGVRFAVNISAFAAIRKFAPGATIDGAARITANSAHTAFKYGADEAPDFGPNSFVGFRASGKYGWLEVTWDSSTDTFEILSGAYEDQVGVAINAGDTGVSAIPEPVSMLSTMGMLASGLLIRRRKLAA